MKKKMKKEEKKRVLNIVSRVIYPFAKIYYGKDIKLLVGVSEKRSSTDLKSVVLNIEEKELEKLYNNISELLWAFKFKMFHEVSHCLFTSREQGEVIKTEMLELWDKEKPKELIWATDMRERAHDLLNCLEDGRIEVLGLQRDRTYKKYRDRVRLSRWKNYDIRGKENPMLKVRNAILNIATCGILPKGYEKWEPCREKEIINSLLGDIEGYITSPSMEKGKEYVLSISKKIAPLVIEAYATNEEDMKEIPPELLEHPEDINFGEDEEVIEGKTGAQPTPILSTRSFPKEKEDDTSSEEGKSSDGEEASEEETETDGKSSESVSKEEGSTKEGYKSKPEDETDSETSESASEDVTLETGEESSEDTDEGEEFSAETKRGEEPDTIEDEVEKALESLKTTDLDLLNRFKKEEKEFLRMENERAFPISAEQMAEIRRLGFPAERPNEVQVIEKHFDYVSSQKKKAETETRKRAQRTLNKIKTLIASKSRPTRTETFEGQIDSNSLDKFLIGQSNIFRSDGRKVDPDIACYILKDNSGSMNEHNKEAQCLKALEEIEETFKPLFPLKIATFTYKFYSDVELHRVIKNWNEKEDFNYTRSYAENYGVVDEDNYDAFSIALATQELLKRREKQKILIVLSDGAPWCNRQESSLVSVNRAVKYARKNGVFVASFFFGTEAFIESSWETYKAMYETHFAGCTPNHLGETLVKFIKAFMKS